MFLDPRSWIQDPGSWIQDPGSLILAASRILEHCVLVLHKEKLINCKGQIETGYTLESDDLTGNYWAKLTFSQNTWNDATVHTVILVVGLWFEHRRKLWFVLKLVFKQIRTSFYVQTEVLLPKWPYGPCDHFMFWVKQWVWPSNYQSDHQILPCLQFCVFIIIDEFPSV